MKALDKVIQAYEICLNINETSCRDCPYTEFNAEGKLACSLCGDCTLDALYYLKAYKDLQNSMNWLAQMEEIRKYLTNLPLTWEELRTMKDKPVWWTHGEVGEWLTIYSIPKNDDGVIYATTCSGTECWIYKKDMDKYQYYRKER